MDRIYHVDNSKKRIGFFATYQEMKRIEAQQVGIVVRDRGRQDGFQLTVRPAVALDEARRIVEALGPLSQGDPFGEPMP